MQNITANFVSGLILLRERAIKPGDVLQVEGQMVRVRSELRQAIWWAFKEAGITIAFPQLDLHLDEPVVESLHRARATA